MNSEGYPRLLWVSGLGEVYLEPEDMTQHFFFQPEKIISVKAGQASQKTAMGWGWDEWFRFPRGEPRLSNAPKVLTI